MVGFYIGFVVHWFMAIGMDIYRNCKKIKPI